MDYLQIHIKKKTLFLLSLIMSDSKKAISKNYWMGKGRRVIAIPKTVLKKKVENNALLKSLYLTEFGYYPKAENHYTQRKKGCVENILIYIVDGSGWFKNKQGQLFNVKRNQFFILPANEPHEYKAALTDPWSIYWLRFKGEGLQDFNKLPQVRTGFKPVDLAYQEKTSELFDDIYNTLSRGYSLDNFIYVNMCFLQYLKLFLYESISENEKIKPPNIADELIRHLQKNMHKTLKVEDFALLLGCSVTHLSYVFKNLTGYSPMDYFIHLKIQKACQYLTITDLLVKEIAYKLGYTDQYYFSRIFSKIMGISPNDYRKNK